MLQKSVKNPFVSICLGLGGRRLTRLHRLLQSIYNLAESSKFTSTYQIQFMVAMRFGDILKFIDFVDS